MKRTTSEYEDGEFRDTGVSIECSRSHMNNILHDILNEQLKDSLELKWEDYVGLAQADYAGGIYLHPQLLYQLYITGRYKKSSTEFALEFDWKSGSRRCLGLPSRGDTPCPVNIGRIKRVAKSAEEVLYREWCNESVNYIDGTWPFNSTTNELSLEYRSRNLREIVIPEIIDVIRLFQERFKNLSRIPRKRAKRM